MPTPTAAFSVRISVTSAGTDAGIPHRKAFKLDGAAGPAQVAAATGSIQKSSYQ